MLDADRVMLMTRLAAYEEGEGKKNIAIGKYFRSDFLGVQILKAVICATLAFLIFFGLYIIYDFEVFMQNLYKIDIIGFAKKILIYYVIFVICYGASAYAYCTYKYFHAKKSLKKYYKNLKKLNSMYGKSGSAKKAGGKR